MASDGYLCGEVRKWIDSHPGFWKRYKCAQLNLKIEIWAPAKEENFVLIAQTVCGMTEWIRSMSFAQFDKEKELEVQIWMAPQALRWCSSAKKISLCNVNSGETWQTKDFLRIRIIRAQSLGRTILHELLHAHNLDRLVVSQHKRFPQETEALVEVVARILYVHWVRDNLFPETSVEEVFGKELEHTQNLARTLYKHDFVAETHVNEYYLMAAAILSNLPLFELWWKKQLSWDRLRDESWQRFFSNGKQTHSDECMALNMVQTQIPWSQLDRTWVRLPLFLF